MAFEVNHHSYKVLIKLNLSWVKVNLVWPLMTPEVILNLLKYLHLYNDSIDRIFYLNRFINESTWRTSKLPQLYSPVVYVLNNEKCIVLVSELCNPFIQPGYWHTNFSRSLRHRLVFPVVCFFKSKKNGDKLVLVWFFMINYFLKMSVFDCLFLLVLSALCFSGGQWLK